ncbi:MAG: hypothetical protein LBT42_01955 [Tannerella sp.]|jgi:hypothetical protein|nr:hypothetical protein [Tannerella sp.]
MSKKFIGVSTMVLMFAMIAPCYGNCVSIKRKKNKWLNAVEQSYVAGADRTNTDTAKNFTVGL